MWFCHVLFFSAVVLQCSDKYILYSSKVNIRVQGTVIGQTNNNRPPNFRSRSVFGTVIQNLFIGWCVVKAAFKTFELII